MTTRTGLSARRMIDEWGGLKLVDTEVFRLWNLFNTQDGKKPVSAELQCLHIVHGQRSIGCAFGSDYWSWSAITSTEATPVAWIFLVRSHSRACSPNTIPKRPSSAMIGGTGLFTRMTPIRNAHQQAYQEGDEHYFHIACLHRAFRALHQPFINLDQFRELADYCFQLLAEWSPICFPQLRT
jgi:hypothetical protein